MGYVFKFGDMNIFLHRQCNGGFIDIHHVYVMCMSNKIELICILIDFISGLCS